MRDALLRVRLFLQRVTNHRLVGAAMSLFDGSVHMDTFDESVDPLLARTCVLEYVKSEENHGHEPRLFAVNGEVLRVWRTYMGYRCERVKDDEKEQL